MDTSDSDEIPELTEPDSPSTSGQGNVLGAQASGQRPTSILPARTPVKQPTPPSMDEAMERIANDYARVAGQTFVAPKPVAASSPDGNYRMVLKPASEIHLLRNQ